MNFSANGCDDVVVGFTPGPGPESKPTLSIRAFTQEESLDFNVIPSEAKLAPEEQCEFHSKHLDGEWYSDPPPSKPQPRSQSFNLTDRPRPTHAPGMGPIVLTDRPRPVRWCNGPDGPQKCDKDEDLPESPSDPPQPWQPQHPTPDCDPDFHVRNISLRSCDDNETELLAERHWHAYRIVKCALRTLDYISGLSEASREFYWNWGSAPAWSHWWHDEPGAVWSALGRWFGPYSSSTLTHVRGVFWKMTSIYEDGVFGWFGRRNMKYKCNNVACGDSVLARHAVRWHTQICADNFFGGNTTSIEWERSRTWVIIHEWLHNVRNGVDPRDRCNNVCSGGWRCGFRQCYQRANEGNPDWLFQTWNFRDNAAHFGNFPRALVADGSLGDARNNVDNFVSWAVARWTDRQWRLCDGPDLSRLPFPPNYP